MVYAHHQFKAGLLAIFLLVTFIMQGQQVVEEKLLQQFQSAGTDNARIAALDQMSEYYYAIKNFDKADSLIEKQIILAESSLNPVLIIQSYFNNAGFQSVGSTTKEQSANTTEYINRALAYAKAINATDYIALAYSKMAALNLAEGFPDKAFKNATLGFTTALNTANDSAKVICALQLGTVYLNRSDILTAFKTYTNALNIATLYKNESLKPPVFHAIANLYKKLQKNDLAKNYINRSRAVNEKIKNIPGLIEDYVFLAKLSNYTAAKQHLQKAIELADGIQNISLKLYAEKILFSFMLLQETPSLMIAYLKEHPELEDLFKNTGPGYLNWMLAEIYLYGGNTDSAYVHFKKAEPAFNTGYDITSKKNFFSEFAYSLKQMNNTADAITYYIKSNELSRATSDLISLKSNSSQLRDLYQQQGDYKQAFVYSVKYDQYKDSVDMLGRERDLALLEVENETREQERQAEIAAAALERKYNLQYMFITIVVATVFVLLIMVGMFKVSAFTIRLMGFLSLIFFFELIILFLDQKIHHLTHGEPWKIWLIKIGIISVILPVHHYLEHKLIHYLLSRHLITVRNRLSLNKFFKRKKTLPPEKAEEEN